MALHAFDTLKFTRKLESGGMPREQAITIAEALSDAQQESIENLATKADIAGLSVETKSEIKSLRAEMREMRLELIIKMGSLIFIAAGLTSGVIITALRFMLKGL